MTFKEWWVTQWLNVDQDIAETIWKAATLAEQERCAIVCDSLSCDYTREGAEVCAEAIRKGEEEVK